jgi:hypothetical protein
MLGRNIWNPYWNFIRSLCIMDTYYGYLLEYLNQNFLGGLMSELKILREWDINDSIHAFAVESPYPRPPTTRYGIDPGTVNMGIAYVHRLPNVSIILYKVKIIRPETVQGRIWATHNVFTQCKLTIDPISEVVIEGASYGAKFRQVELEDVRAATVVWFNRCSA